MPGHAQDQGGGTYRGTYHRQARVKHNSRNGTRPLSPLVCKTAEPGECGTNRQPGSCHSCPVLGPLSHRGSVRSSGACPSVVISDKDVCSSDASSPRGAPRPGHREPRCSAGGNGNTSGAGNSIPGHGRRASERDSKGACSIWLCRRAMFDGGSKHAEGHELASRHVSCRTAG